MSHAADEFAAAPDLQALGAAVVRAARAAVAADGATFVLREGGQCHYAAEDAVSPLWSGQRFPSSICISGWVMEHRQPAVIADIEKDARIPYNIYKTTFVRSLAMIPLLTPDPVGCIGAYWSRKGAASPEAARALETLGKAAVAAMRRLKIP